MATKYSTHGEIRSLRYSVFHYRFCRVLRTTRYETARGGEKRRKEILVDLDQEYGEKSHGLLSSRIQLGQLEEPIENASSLPKALSKPVDDKKQVMTPSKSGLEVPIRFSSDPLFPISPDRPATSPPNDDCNPVRSAPVLPVEELQSSSIHPPRGTEQPLDVGCFTEVFLSSKVFFHLRRSA